MDKLEREIANKISKYLKTIIPPDTAVEINESRFLEVALVCPKKDSIMGYYCCLSPGHLGECYSRNKQVNFMPSEETW